MASAISPPREGESKLEPSSAANSAAVTKGTVTRVSGTKPCSSIIPPAVAAPMTYHFLSVSAMSAIGAQKTLPAFGASPIATIEAAVNTGRPALVTRYGTTTVMYPLVIPNGRLSRRKVEGCGESLCEDTSVADARICDLRNFLDIVCGLRGWIILGDPTVFHIVCATNGSSRHDRIRFGNSKSGGDGRLVGGWEVNFRVARHLSPKDIHEEKVVNRER